MAEIVDIGAAEATRIMATIAVETVMTMAGTTTSIISPKHRGLIALPEWTPPGYGNCSRKNSCGVFVGAELVKIKFPAPSN